MMNHRHSTERPHSRWSGAQSLSGAMLVGLLLAAAPGWASDGDRTTHRPGTHMNVTGVVSQVQPDLLTVKTSWGRVRIASATAPNNLEVGDEVTLWLNEENLVIDHHGKQKNRLGAHRVIAGKLIYAGLTKKEIKLWTPDGEQVFPLDRMEVKTKPIAEGTKVIVELDEHGTVIDLRKSES